jgi:hypothetical protein
MFNSLMGKYSGPGLSSALDRPFAAIGGAGFTKGPSNANEYFLTHGRATCGVYC